MSNQKMYMSLIRGWDWDVIEQQWHNYSKVKYILPDYFQNIVEWNKRGNGWQDRWHNELMVHVGEEFDYKWMPVGEPKLLTHEEMEEMRNV